MHTLYRFQRMQAHCKTGRSLGTRLSSLYTWLIALKQSLHVLLSYWCSINFLFYLRVEQDRVSLVPQIPQEVGYFWTEPTISPDVFSQIKIDDKGDNYGMYVCTRFLHVILHCIFSCWICIKVVCILVPRVYTCMYTVSCKCCYG